MKEIVTQKVEKVKKYSIFSDTSQQEQPESFLDKCRKRYYALLRQKLNEFYIEKSKETDDKIAAQIRNRKKIIFHCENLTAHYYPEINRAVVEYKGSMAEKYFGYPCIIPELATLRHIVAVSRTALTPWINQQKAYRSKHFIHCIYNNSDYAFCFDNNDTYAMSKNAFSMAVLRISTKDFIQNVLSKKFDVGDESIQDIVKTMKGFRRFCDCSGNEGSMSEEELEALAQSCHLPVQDLRRQAEEELRQNNTSGNAVSEETFENYIHKLLTADRKRADLEPYDRQYLDDINAGLWELWEDMAPETAHDTAETITLPHPMIARNPAADIHEDGLIGIDFGTKSTIVSMQNGQENTSLLRVGIGQLSKEAEDYHYENPTIIELRHIDTFREAYCRRQGRPDTDINDMCVSHKANNHLKDCTANDSFYSFFYDIKQWCGDKEVCIKLLDQDKKEILLKPFIESDDDLDPLEWYAYYLGLYINNMRNGIFMDYVMSFPVTYEKEVKKKIIRSFEKGLKKSLPDTIVRDEELMKKFRVQAGVSEPAAYAITALKGYGFEPEEKKSVLYAIFDFGGGTTDFDFGLWRWGDESKRDERDYDYVIEHFGSNGDRYLGGENLLALLAYEIFKANVPFLGQQRKDQVVDKDKSAGFSFTRPKECKPFAGSEMFIADSQEARRNTKQVMEALRPFWEGIVGISGEEEGNHPSCVEYEGYWFRNDEECRFPIDDGILKVDLFDKDGKRHQNQVLYITNNDNGISIDLKLTAILEQRIKRGVDNFFTALDQAFRNEPVQHSGARNIQIFLAGNASKSPILRKVFDEYIRQSEKDNPANTNMKKWYHLFPPLGTAEAVAIQHERGIDTEQEIIPPTGKTGVAYGLIYGRDGGSIKVKSEITAEKQANFRYYVGVARRGKLKVVLNGNVHGYGKWMVLCAAKKDFEIYYTSLPKAITGTMSINESGIYKKRCRLEQADSDQDIYIRTIEEAPEDIEYCVSKEMPTEETETCRISLKE
ncbi:MAG TPA: hypothetical protein DEO95_06860 [Ruminococcaceae bacterium]|nr:hypothetical protein [Oscillospiraceae bacterium]